MVLKQSAETLKPNTAREFLNLFSCSKVTLLFVKALRKDAKKWG